MGDTTDTAPKAPPPANPDTALSMALQAMALAAGLAMEGAPMTQANVPAPSAPAVASAGFGVPGHAPAKTAKTA
jgi:hypothetical protein